MLFAQGIKLSDLRHEVQLKIKYEGNMAMFNALVDSTVSHCKKTIEPDASGSSCGLKPIFMKCE